MSSTMRSAPVGHGDSVSDRVGIMSVIQPGKLLSLFEMMKFNASAFYESSLDLRAAEKLALEKKPEELISDAIKDRAIGCLNSLLVHLKDINAQVTIIACTELIEKISGNQSILCLDFTRQIEELNATLRRELSIVELYVLSKDESNLYHYSQIWFDEVGASKIENVSTDLSEAGKAHALGRYTASVFHLMRVVEQSLRTVAEHYKIDLEKAKNWQNVLDKLNSYISKLDNGDPSKKELSEIATHLFNVKLAWRNEVMHPKGTYTKEESESVLHAVRSTLGAIAKNLPSTQS